MNKPAPKEPSMDEILSSIRQIIADDDAGAAPVKPMTAAAAAPPVRSMTQPPAAKPAAPSQAKAPMPEPEPLALSPEQILRDTAAEDSAKPGLSFSELLGSTPEEASLDASMLDADDISFEVDEEFDIPPAMAAVPEPTPVPVFVPPPAAGRPAPRPVAQAAPMPDPSLSAEIAEQLLEPATQSAVKSTFAKLSGMQTVGSGVTLEDMMREMLRPMLKEWLDENLPAVVERMVEREIARVSRGK